LDTPHGVVLNTVGCRFEHPGPFSMSLICISTKIIPGTYIMNGTPRE
jgi:hypothetical protein